jgi:hypothetical protein
LVLLTRIISSRGGYTLTFKSSKGSCKTQEEASIRPTVKTSEGIGKTQEEANIRPNCQRTVLTLKRTSVQEPLNKKSKEDNKLNQQ